MHAEINTPKQECLKKKTSQIPICNGTSVFPFTLLKKLEYALMHGWYQSRSLFQKFQKVIIILYRVLSSLPTYIEAWHLITEVYLLLLPFKITYIKSQRILSTLCAQFWTLYLREHPMNLEKERLMG